MNVTTSASITIPRARETVFELATQNDTYERALLPYGPIAGVVEVQLVEGGALQRGALREAWLTDGSVLVEEILEHDVPTRHRYKWTGGLKPPIAWLLRSGEGTWTFSEVTDGTRIEWSYEFELRSPLAYTIAPPMAALFRRYQKKALARIRDLALELPERDASRPATSAHTQSRA
jgi:hypothetical protein